MRLIDEGGGVMAAQGLKVRIDGSFYSLESDPADGNALKPRPTVGVYEYNDKNVGFNPFRDSHSTEGFIPLPVRSQDGITALNDIVTIVATAPVDAARLELFYGDLQATVGTTLGAGSGSADDTHTLIADFPVAEWFPSGFNGQIWAVSTDTDGNEHYSDKLKVVYAPQGDGMTARNSTDPVQAVRAELEAEGYRILNIFNVNNFTEQNLTDGKEYNVASIYAEYVEGEYGDAIYMITTQCVAPQMMTRRSGRTRNPFTGAVYHTEWLDTLPKNITQPQGNPRKSRICVLLKSATSHRMCLKVKWTGIKPRSALITTTTRSLTLRALPYSSVKTVKAIGKSPIGRALQIKSRRGKEISSPNTVVRQSTIIP
jgi:hypothetical protein